MEDGMNGSGAGSELQDVKTQVALANRVLADLGLATGVLASLGHASLRVPSDPGRFVVKGRGYAIDALARMRPEDMVVCDLEGYKVAGPEGVSQCFEVQLHAAIYRARPDVQSVVHVHPRFVVVMSVLGAPLVPMCQEGIQLVRNPLPVYPHVKTVQSREEGEAVAGLLGQEPAIILQGHGAATTGDGLDEAVTRMLCLEEQARMNWYATCAAGPDHPRIGDDLIREMTERPRPSELPHFQNLPARSSPPRGAVWKHYADLAARGLQAPGAPDL